MVTFGMEIDGMERRGKVAMGTSVDSSAYFCKRSSQGRVSQGESGLPAGVGALALASRGRD